MELQEQVGKIQTRDHLVLFIQYLVEDLRPCPERWENSSLETHLEALGAWLQDMDGYYHNRGQTAPEHPTWRHVGEILLTARMYE